MSSLWLASNQDETEWYVMDGVEMIAGPMPKDESVEKMREELRKRAGELLKLADERGS